MQEKDVLFSDSRELMNNQINYFSSTTIGNDLTGFYQSMGIYPEGWENPENRMETGYTVLNNLNNSYKFGFFTGLGTDLEDIRTEFYQGWFNRTEDIPSLLEKHQKRNKTIHQIMDEYQGIRDTISTLESENEPVFYMRYSVELNNTIDYLKDSKFQEANETVQNVALKVEERNNSLNEYNEDFDRLNNSFNQLNILIKPFTFDADTLLRESKEEYLEGDLENAHSLLDKSESKIKRSKYIAGVVYLAILIIIAISVLWIRKK